MRLHESVIGAVQVGAVGLHLAATRLLGHDQAKGAIAKIQHPLQSLVAIISQLLAVQRPCNQKQCLVVGPFE